MSKIITEAIMTCPNCSSKYKQRMPRIGKHLNARCVFCHTIFGITDNNDCRVYCTYGNVLCPEAQKNINKRK